MLRSFVLELYSGRISVNTKRKLEIKMGLLELLRKFDEDDELEKSRIREERSAVAVFNGTVGNNGVCHANLDDDED
jgi:hypothetical protein